MMDTTGPAPSTLTQVAAAHLAPKRGYRVTSTGPIHCRLQTNELIVPPFHFRRLRQSYISDVELRIDLTRVVAGRYRILAVHNFHVEDRNPRLDECVAGVFLAAWRNDGRWEEPERFPVECRSLAVLGEIAVSEPCDVEGNR